MNCSRSMSISIHPIIISFKTGYFLTVVFLFLTASMSAIYAQTARVYEQQMMFKTYPYSDPDPVPEIGRIYPYFYFDGYTSTGLMQEWKMVVLENDYIKVFICPDIGGKIWGAVEKSTGKEFLYFNHVVKFRDVAMRGAWTSGGLEYNFGDIGHIPTCASPVDYITKENSDGSVSCVIGATDLPSGTKWNVEVFVYPDKAFFETKVRWFNNSSLPCTYYHWMNAAARADGNLEFIYPGNKKIGHGGEVGEWPREMGRDLNYYENNDFGIYKSYHVINSYSEFFGGYWHDDDFGFGHYSPYDDKPGKKLWIWGLSQQGMIWEDLLTDGDGQYIEFQAGKLFNQAAHNSTFTPFKHKEFTPHDSDVMHEIWFPLKGTGGMVAASPFGILNAEKEGNTVTVVIGALQHLNDRLIIKEGDKIISDTMVKLSPLESGTYKFTSSGEPFSVHVGTDKLMYSSNVDDVLVDRPVEPFKNFDWNSTFGLYTKALELEKQRRFSEALVTYGQVLELDAGFLPALNRAALGHYRRMDYIEAQEYINSALSINTYDAEANYLFGLINKKLGKTAQSKSGFSIAAGTPSYRSAAYTELARLFLKEKNYLKSLQYTDKALAYNILNLTAHQMKAILYRKTTQTEQAEEILAKLLKLNAVDHFVRFEQYLVDKSEAARDHFIKNIRNEIPAESFLELAVLYNELDCIEEAKQVLKLAPDHPVVHIWLASLDTANADNHIQKAVTASPYLVFPYRNETALVLERIVLGNNHWKLKYYLGLIYWNRGLDSKAKKLLDACGEEPDYAPFYLAKAKLISDTAKKRECLIKSASLDKNDWRAALALIDFYLENGEAEQAFSISERFKDLYPGQASIGLAFARSLMRLEKYEEAVEFLDGYTMLPFEGATVGRDIFHEACVRIAINASKSEEYYKVIEWVEKAREWPVNLGVGRPYDVDERIEDYMTAYAHEQLGNTRETKAFFNRVANYVHPDEIGENSKLYLQLAALKKTENIHQAKQLIIKFKKTSHKNRYVQWAIAKFNGDQSAVKLEKDVLQSKKILQPYDTAFVDKEFTLLLNLLNINF